MSKLLQILRFSTSKTAGKGLRGIGLAELSVIDTIGSWWDLYQQKPAFR